jgi:pimeloyl-ACP methyl ester carboxylesterase
MSIFYRLHGSRESRGVPVLCMHGYWRNSRDFEDLAPHLAKNRRVITPDLRGRGESDRATKVVVLGMTLGGMVALEMASTRPDRVVGLVLNDEGPERPPDWEGKMTILWRGQFYPEGTRPQWDIAIVPVCGLRGRWRREAAGPRVAINRSGRRAIFLPAGIRY